MKRCFSGLVAISRPRRNHDRRARCGGRASAIAGLAGGFGEPQLVLRSPQAQARDDTALQDEIEKIVVEFRATATGA